MVRMWVIARERERDRELDRGVEIVIVTRQGKAGQGRIGIE